MMAFHADILMIDPVAATEQIVNHLRTAVLASLGR